MALESRLDLKLTQKLILTPQLQLAIKLLQMPQLELAQSLNTELIENPFLEELTDDSLAREYQMEELTHSLYKDIESPLENMINFSVDEYFEERGSDGRDLGYFFSGIEEQPSYEVFYTKKPDLYDHLFWQLRLCNACDDIRKVAEAVIGNIDEDGYLRATEDELASSLSVDIDTVNSAITLVQSFDPAGVGARNLKECLLLQIKALDLEKTLVEKIVENNMEDLQKRRYDKIAKQYDSTVEDIMNAVKIIERLEPRPGIGLSSAEVNYVVPDVYISNVEGEYQIRLNDEYIPRIGLNKRLILTSDEKEYIKRLLTEKTEAEKKSKDRELYSRLLKKLSGERVDILFTMKDEERKILNDLISENSGIHSSLSFELKEKIGDVKELTEGEKNFLKEKFRTASELIDSLDQRNRTIYKVSESILKFQKAFFDHGVQHLKPLNLRDIASDINMHESTVSRVTSNKFLACSHGVFSFRFFFSSAIKSENGDLSSTTVKDLIKKIVSEEDPKKPLSDQAITEELKRQNISIARRTVAKYREELRIPPQNQRKRH